MNKQARRSRTRRMMAIGALVGTLMSVGAISDSASAAKPASATVNDDGASVSVEVGFGWGTTSMRSGVRW